MVWMNLCKLGGMKQYRDTQYYVTPDGNVFSKHTNKFLKALIHPQGYLMFSISTDTKQRKYAHRLVAECYIPNPDNKRMVNHIDGNKRNNHVSNLEWCTSSDNNKHAYNTGLKKSLKGEQSGRSKLTDKQALEIYQLKGVETQTNIANRYGITYQAVGAIQNKKTYKHIHMRLRGYKKGTRLTPDEIRELKSGLNDIG